MATLEEIREAIAKAVGGFYPNSDYMLIQLSRNTFDMSKEEKDKLRTLMLHFNTNSNILALQLIYKKYIK